MEGMLNYFVPEDGDSSDHLNVVPLPRVDQLRLQHVKKCFPLPGDFHFRFKTAFEGTYVWLDVVNDADAVPDYNGLVISKISRVQRASATPAAAKQPAPAKPQPVKAPDLIETSLPPTPSAKREEQPAPAKAFNDDLVGLLADPVPTTSPNTSAPPTPTPAAAPVPQDPFNLFMGSSGGGGGAPAMRPGSAPMNASRGPNQGNPQGYGGAPAFNPMGSGGPGSMGSGGPGSMGSGGPGSMGPRPSGNMNISQMHMGMSQPPQQQQQQQQQNSFQGLQWQGMGQPSQVPPPRNPMQPNSRQW